MNPPSRPHPAASTLLRRPRVRPRLARVGLGVVALVTVAACSGTTYDPTFATTATTAAVTTTTIPTGSAAELLPLLRTEAASLSGVMIAEGDEDAVVERILALWEATKAEIGQARPDLVPGFDQNIALVEKAVQFSRAADADKASKNLDALVAAFLGE